jgi:hypothetical protein
VKRRRRRGLGEPSKQDFEAAARILKRHCATPGVVDDFAAYYQAKNPRFNTGLFKLAATCRR